MNHYTYKITFENGMKYIGVRSCKCEINEDTYLGSSKVIPSELYSTCVKEILGVFSTRVEAIANEIKLHGELDIALNPEYYNQVKQSAKLFDQQGTTKETHNHIREMANKLKGRTISTHPYLGVKGKQASSKRGLNRTQAQLEADKQVSLTQKGIKNPLKGNSGADNPQFKPWYFITPFGEYYEVFTSIREYCSSSEWSYTAVSRAIRENSNLPMLRGNLKGYVFGTLISKPEYLTQENIILALKVLMHLPMISPNRESFGKGNITNITGEE